MMPTENDRPKPSRDPISLLLPLPAADPKWAATVDAWRQALDKLGRDYEILVVVDPAHSEELGLADPPPAVRILKREGPSGFGASLAAGIAATTHPNVAYAGPGHNPAHLKKLVEMLDQFDLVSTSRAGPVPSWLRTLGRLYRGVVRVLFGVQTEPRTTWRGWAEWRRVQRLRWQFGVLLSDPLCDYKVFRRSVLDRIAIQSDGDFVHAELLAKANFLGALMAEVAIDPPSRAPAPVDNDYLAEMRRVFRNPAFLRTTVPV